MHKVVFSFLIILTFIFDLFADKKVEGKVISKETSEPLAFVHIYLKESKSGTLTDIDGFFSVQVDSFPVTLQASYMGYETWENVIRSGDEPIGVVLVNQTLELAEVIVYPGENPAHRIIKNAIENRKKNDPEQLNTFRYQSYNKFVATFDRDFYLQKWQLHRDSAALDLVNTIDNRHVFMMESVTERRFRKPGKNNETILANRVSGLKNPLFTMVATQLQSFSFYVNHITFMESRFVSPLNPLAFNGYFYHLTDTLFNQPDTTYIIEYRPARNTNFDGLSGVLYINTDKWAVQNVIAEPFHKKESGLDFRIQQKYERVDGENWFPVQLNTDFVVELPEETTEGMLSPVKMAGRTYLRDIEINQDIPQNEFSPYDVDFDPHANLVPPRFWEENRSYPLTTKETNTYIVMDSIGREANLDGLINSVEPFLYGELPLGYLSLDLRSVYRFNGYEGHRLGMGLYTNRLMSERFSVGGYFGYGTFDKTWKYGYSADILLNKNREVRLRGGFSLDVHERGGTTFSQQQLLFSPSLVRNLYTNTYDITRKWYGVFSFRSIQNYLYTGISFNTGSTWWEDLYYFIPDPSENEGFRSFDFSEAAVRFRFAWGETFMNTPLRVIQLPGTWPVFHLNIIKGFDNSGMGDFDYLKVESKIDIHYPVPRLGEQTWILEGGWINRSDLPWPLLYTAKAGGRLSWISAPLSFGTMDINEFVASRYVTLSFLHSFQNLIIRSPIYEPELVLITNLGWGYLDGTDNHVYSRMQDWREGYFESGIAINKLLPQKWVRRVVFGLSPGVELLYRYGPYSFDDPMKNLTIKMSLVTAL